MRLYIRALDLAPSKLPLVIQFLDPNFTTLHCRSLRNTKFRISKHMRSPGKCAENRQRCRREPHSSKSCLSAAYFPAYRNPRDFMNVASLPFHKGSWRRSSGGTMLSMALRICCIDGFAYSLWVLFITSKMTTRCL